MDYDSIIYYVGKMLDDLHKHTGQKPIVELQYPTDQFDSIHYSVGCDSSLNAFDHFPSGDKIILLGGRLIITIQQPEASDDK